MAVGEVSYVHHDNGDVTVYVDTGFGTKVAVDKISASEIAKQTDW